MLSLIAVADVAAMVVGATVLLDVWFFAPAMGVLILDLLLIHSKVTRRRRSRYPLVPPAAKPDAYLPRTNIPRPIVEDFRKMREMKRKFQRLQHLARRSLSKKRK